MATPPEKEEKKRNEQEGADLLGSPTFEQLENGRLRCAETGHELPVKETETYSRSKRCRLGLIDAALSKNKPPLNMFKQDPASSSKLICKLTGDTVNKSEAHIWKHINGRRFLNRLEQKESGELTSNGNLEEKNLNADSVKKKKKEKKKQEKDVGEIISEVRDSADKGSDSEEGEFWMPPVGSRWDFDDGGDRWGSDADSDSGDESEQVPLDEEGAVRSEELSKGTKRMSIEIGPSSFASRKKKSKVAPQADVHPE